MNEAIIQLEPKGVWKNFTDLNAVPRPSKKEERVIQFMLDFGNSLKLETFKDEVGNVIIRKPATAGMEDRKTTVLQSHLDMVHQKNTDTDFDFDTQGIQMYIDGDWVKAKGTTLGADNGIGVATIMALLESEDIPHPSLEALFTIDEETGMTGAMGLKGGILKSEVLLNLDTEEDDEIDIGCAGGIDVTANGVYIPADIPKNHESFKITVKGLQGGHSGIDIHRGRGNANKIMNRLLYNCLQQFDAQIVSIDGGSLRNAIPRESSAVLVMNAQHKDDFPLKFENWILTIKRELSVTEPDLIMEAKSVETPNLAMTFNDGKKLINSVYSAHNGVYAMSASIPDLVETSNNVARVLVEDGSIKIGCLTRSSVDSAKMDLANSLKSAFELAGYQVTFGGNYPGWNPNPNSAILEVSKEKYIGLFNEKPKVVACHAGLECGILGQNYPEMDMISFGPTIEGAHSPDERVSISSVQKFWKFLLGILNDIPQK